MKILRTIYELILRLISSKRFIWVIIGLLVFQALWIALSFRFPMLYDEVFHVDAVALFSQQLSPIIVDQPLEYDVYGTLSHGGATLFHYLLSFPYRIINVFTENLAVLVVSLRVVCIALFAAGVYFYSRLFGLIGVSRATANIGLLVFIMLPIVPFVAATVNYDNGLFLLTGLFFLSAAKIILDKKINILQIAALITFGCIASLMKSTFLPVFAISAIYLIALLMMRHGRQLGIYLVREMRTQKRLRLFLLMIVMAISIVAFSSIYFQNILVYGGIGPRCEKVLSVERCAANSVAIRDNNALATKETRPLAQTPEYISEWMVQMVNWTNMTGSRTASSGTVIRQPLPILYTTVFIGGIVAFGLILYAWDSIRRNKAWHYLIIIALGLIVVVFFQNYATYIKLHVAYAVQPRYILTVMPILITFAVAASAYITRKNIFFRLLALVLMAFLLSQGGGLVTHIVQSSDDWYWDNSNVRDINRTVRDTINPIIKNETR